MYYLLYHVQRLHISTICELLQGALERGKRGEFTVLVNPMEIPSVNNDEFWGTNQYRVIHV